MKKRISKRGNTFVVILDRRLLKGWFPTHNSFRKSVHISFNVESNDLLISPRKTLWNREIILNETYMIGIIGNSYCVTIPNMILKYWSNNELITKNLDIECTNHPLGLFISPIGIFPRG